MAGAPHPSCSAGSARRGCREKEREKKGEGKGGRKRKGEEGARRRERPRKAKPAAPRPPRPTPGTGPALTFQVTARGRREPLLGFTAHQLQADLQHFRVPDPRGPAPPDLLRRALGSPRPAGSARPPGPPRPRHAASPPPRAPAQGRGRVSVSALDALVNKGPRARPARPAPASLTALTPSAPRRAAPGPSLGVRKAQAGSRPLPRSKTNPGSTSKSTEGFLISTAFSGSQRWEVRS